MAFSYVPINGSWPGQTGYVAVSPIYPMTNEGHQVNSRLVYPLVNGSVSFEVAATDSIGNDVNGLYQFDINVSGGNSTSFSTKIPSSYEATGLSLNTQLPLNPYPDTSHPGAYGNGLPSNSVTKTTAYTAAANDFVNADCTSAGFTVTLPTSPATGALVAVKKVSNDANTLTIAPGGGGTIDGQSTLTTATQWAGVVLEHIGSNVWRVAASMTTTGPQGPQGPVGPTGPQGPAGNNPTKAYYGDGSDGTATCDGSTAVAGMSLSGSTYTLTRSVYFASLTVNNGVSVFCNGWILNCSGTLTVNSGGIIHDDGRIPGAGAGSATATDAAANGSGTGNSGGDTQANAVLLGYGRAGGLANGSAGTNSTQSFGGAGGAGGSASSGANAGGSGGTVSGFGSAAPDNTRMVWTATTGAMFGSAIPGATIYGGAGGGGAGNDGTNQGGGGGGGGGVLVVNTYGLVNNGAIHARGANGANAVSTGDSGGGGGGGGGVVLVNLGSAATGSGTIDANGGSGGTGNGTGANGSAGSAGIARVTVWG